MNGHSTYDVEIENWSEKLGLSISWAYDSEYAEVKDIHVLIKAYKSMINPAH